MPVDRAALAALAEEIGRFHIRDRTFRRAQAKMTSALATGETPNEAAVLAYLNAVRIYFAGFEREARSHLLDLDRRLAKASQVHFNLTAERGVAARRIERTQGVLARLAELAAR